MNPSETMKLLIAAKAIDDRVAVDKERAQAWTAVLNEMTLEEARDALIGFYKTNVRQVMPADINEYVRMHRRANIQPVQRELPEISGEIPVAVREALKSFRERVRLK